MEEGFRTLIVYSFKKKNNNNELLISILVPAGLIQVNQVFQMQSLLHI